MGCAALPASQHRRGSPSLLETGLDASKAGGNQTCGPRELQARGCRERGAVGGAPAQEAPSGGTDGGPAPTLCTRRLPRRPPFVLYPPPSPRGQEHRVGQYIVPIITQQKGRRGFMWRRRAWGPERLRHLAGLRAEGGSASQRRTVRTPAPSDGPPDGSLLEKHARDLVYTAPRAL